MRAILMFCLALSSSTALAAEKTFQAQQWAPPLHARACPKPVWQLKPGEVPRMRQLSQLPPAELYAAVYYADGCPRRLIEAQGKARR